MADTTAGTEPIDAFRPGLLAGRRALVTGAGVGIGLASARALAAAGASIVLHHHGHREQARAAAAAICEAGGSAWAEAADLTRADEAVRLVDAAAARLNGLDILVSNAGITLSRPFEATDAEALDEVWGLNVRSGFIALRRALPHLEANGYGAVVLMTSVHGVAGFPGHAAYAATKGALIALARELAIELAPRGIRVNAIGPGIVEVPRYFDIPGYTSELGARMSPLGRVGRPADVAAAVVYLCSEAAGFVTGHTLWVDGGATAKMALEWDRSDIR